MTDTHLSGDGERLEEIAAGIESATEGLPPGLGGNSAKRDAAFLRDLATRLAPENGLRAALEEIRDRAKGAGFRGPVVGEIERLADAALAASPSPENSSGVEEERERLEVTEGERDEAWEEARELVRSLLSECNWRATGLACHDELRGGKVRPARDPKLDGEIAGLEAAVAALTQPVSPQPDPTTRHKGDDASVIDLVACFIYNRMTREKKPTPWVHLTEEQKEHPRKQARWLLDEIRKRDHPTTRLSEGTGE